MYAVIELTFGDLEHFFFTKHVNFIFLATKLIKLHTYYLIQLFDIKPVYPNITACLLCLGNYHISVSDYGSIIYRFYHDN